MGIAAGTPDPPPFDTAGATGVTHVRPASVSRWAGDSRWRAKLERELAEEGHHGVLGAAALEVAVGAACAHRARAHH